MKKALLFLSTLAATTVFGNNLPFAIPYPNVVLCVQNGRIRQAGPNTIEFAAQDCGGHFLPDEKYVGAISILQINGGNGGYRIALPGERPGVWYFATNPGPMAQFSIAVVYSRLH